MKYQILFSGKITNFSIMSCAEKFIQHAKVLKDSQSFPHIHFSHLPWFQQLKRLTKLYCWKKKTVCIQDILIQTTITVSTKIYTYYILTHCRLNELPHRYWKILFQVCQEVCQANVISTFLEKNRWTICKQWRPWSDAAFCAVWSGSALFAKYSFWGLQTTKG